jgi:hypothetical protein
MKNRLKKRMTQSQDMEFGVFSSNFYVQLEKRTKGVGIASAWNFL